MNQQANADEFDAISRRGRELGFLYPCSLITPGTVFTHARRPDVRRRLLASLRTAKLDDLDHWRIELLEAGIRRCGDAWDFLDNVCVAHAFAELARPANVLEIGVRRGMCTVAIAAASPDSNLYCVDSWVPNYSMRENPGPAAVRPNLLAVGHRGAVHFHSGDSHSVLPELFRQRPELFFDLILVDGDHTDAGALQDLAAGFSRLAPGGMLAFDDIAHPQFLELAGVWRRCMNELTLRVRSAEYIDQGHGIAIAMRATRALPDAGR